MQPPSFYFRTQALTDDPFEVIGFKGEEGLSRLYRYQIELRAPDRVLPDLDAVLAAGAEFSVEQDGDSYLTYGVLAGFEVRHSAGGFTWYQAELVPRLWRHAQYRTNQVFLNKSVDEVIRDVLDNGADNDGDGTPLCDYTLSLTASYPVREYWCQFRESNFDFLARLMEHYGLYFFFDHDINPDRETLVISDALPYPGLDESGSRPADFRFLVGTPDFESVHALACRKRALPASVTLRDFDPDQPSTEVAATEAVDADGIGQEYLYGEHLRAGEAPDLARVRAEELQARKTRYFGESSIAALRAGFAFGIEGHPNGLYNRRYLLLGIQHEGNQVDTSIRSRASAALPRYRNSFEAMEAEVQYRPPCATPRPRFYGTMSARIYSEQNSGLAEVDGQGRYRVRLPFDRAGGTGQKATHFIRMAQPYVGEQQGVYFPLKHGTEVLLTFLNGDPNRPMIAAAVPNPSTPSLLNETTSHIACINTDADLMSLETRGGFYRRYQARPSTDYTPPNVAADFVFPRMNNSAVRYTDNPELDPQADEKSGDFIVERVYGPQYHWNDGPSYTWDNQPSYEFGNGYTEVHQWVDYANPTETDYSAGCDLDNTDASLHEAHRQAFAIPTTPAAVPSDFDELADGLVEKVWGNTYEYHHGNAYSWAHNSTKNFAYGNGYTENLVNTEAPTGTHRDNSIGEVTAASALIEKTFGDTYGYQHGKSVEIRDGNSLAKTWGDTVEEVYGLAKTTHHGRCEEYFLGGKNEMTLAGCNEMKLAVYNETVGGLATETFIGGKLETVLISASSVQLGPALEFYWGLKTDIALGSKIEVDLATKLEQKSTELTNKINNIASGMTIIKMATVDMAKRDVSLKQGLTEIKQGALMVFG